MQSTQQEKPETSEPLIIERVAICINEPRGDAGLEGYQRGESYRAQHVKQEGQPPYYRIYPSKETPEYYETGVPRVICRYFSIDDTL